MRSPARRTPPRLLPFGPVTDVTRGRGHRAGDRPGERRARAGSATGAAGPELGGRGRGPAVHPDPGGPARAIRQPDADRRAAFFCPTTRAPATSTRARWTAPTCSATRTTTARTRETRHRRRADRVPRGRRHLAAGRPGRARPRRLEVSLGSPAAGRAPRLISAADHLGELDCDRTGQASVVEVRGTIHWLTHRDGPARAMHVDPASRARLPRVLGDRAGGLGHRRHRRRRWRSAGETRRRRRPPPPARRGPDRRRDRIAASPDGSRSRRPPTTASPDRGRGVRAGHRGGGVRRRAVDGLSWSPDSAWLAWSQPGSGRCAGSGWPPPSPAG